MVVVVTVENGYATSIGVPYVMLTQSRALGEGGGPSYAWLAGGTGFT